MPFSAWFRSNDEAFWPFTCQFFSITHYAFRITHFKTYAFTLRKVTFYRPKPILLSSKTYAFAEQNITFCNRLIIRWLRFYVFFRRHEIPFYWCKYISLKQCIKGIQLFSIQFYRRRFPSTVTDYRLQFSQQQSDVVQMTDDSFLSTTYIIMKVISFFNFRTFSRYVLSDFSNPNKSKSKYYY